MVTFTNKCRTNPHSLAYRIPEGISFTPGTRDTRVTVAVGGTKLERAAELMRRFPSANRQFILELFMRHLSMTQAGAATYYTLLKAQSDWTKGCETGILSP